MTRSKIIRTCIAAVASAVSFTTLAIAQEGTPGPQGLPAKAASRAAAVQNYWTTERMRSAKPMDVGAFSRETSTKSGDLAPIGPAGAARGWRPGSGAQPGPNDRVDIESIRTPRTAPPFS